jgi:uncharacterized DUF497 family protein
MAFFEFIQWVVDWIENQSTFNFEWDAGNQTKNFIKHQVTVEEAESVFEDVDAIVALGKQVRPSVNELRFGILGITKNFKHVFICFTVRVSKIRIVNVRPMNKKERNFYHEALRKKH